MQCEQCVADGMRAAMLKELTEILAAQIDDGMSVVRAGAVREQFNALLEIK